MVGFAVPALHSKGLITNILPLHQADSLKQLQQNWVLTLFEEQPLDLINSYFGTEIAMYFAWLGYMTTALWLPASIGMLCFISSLATAEVDTHLSQNFHVDHILCAEKVKGLATDFCQSYQNPSLLF